MPFTRLITFLLSGFITGCLIENGTSRSQFDTNPNQALTSAKPHNRRPQPTTSKPTLCCGSQTILSEPWDTFRPTVWIDFGDHIVDSGFFYAKAGASSATADLRQPTVIKIDSLFFVRFSNKVELRSTTENSFAESGALFLVEADSDGSYQNYIFLNVGYTMNPSHVFVEAFGANGGVDFDQFEETSLSYAASQSFLLELVIEPKAFRINVAGYALDTVTLTTPVSGISLFEVGVQQPLGGLRGLIDQTTITGICRGGNPLPPRIHPSCKGQMLMRVGPNCMTRNHYVHWAKVNLPKCTNPSKGLRLLANMNEIP